MYYLEPIKLLDVTDRCSPSPSGPRSPKQNLLLTLNSVMLFLGLWLSTRLVREHSSLDPMACLPLISRLLFIQLEEGRKRIYEFSPREKLLCAWSMRGEPLCPWPVFSLEVSDPASSREVGKATYLCAQEEKEVGFMSVSQSLPQASTVFSLFTPRGITHPHPQCL